MRLSDSTSNYHGMQLYAAKRKGDLLMTTSYTWSKVLTDASGFNDNPEDPFNRKFNYGPATFDRRHVFALTYTYTLKMFSRTRVSPKPCSTVMRSAASRDFSQVRT